MCTQEGNIYSKEKKKKKKKTHKKKLNKKQHIRRSFIHEIIWNCTMTKCAHTSVEAKIFEGQSKIPKFTFTE